MSYKADNSFCGKNLKKLQFGFQRGRPPVKSEDLSEKNSNCVLKRSNKLSQYHRFLLKGGVSSKFKKSTPDSSRQKSPSEQEENQENLKKLPTLKDIKIFIRPKGKSRNSHELPTNSDLYFEKKRSSITPPPLPGSFVKNQIETSNLKNHPSFRISIKHKSRKLQQLIKPRVFDPFDKSK